MRKMLNTLFIASEDAYLALENENVVVFRGEEKMGSIRFRFWKMLCHFLIRERVPR